jgi:hypothetical protein
VTQPTVKLLAAAVLALALAGCGRAMLPVAGGAPSAAASSLLALAKKKKLVPTPKDGDDKTTAGKIATKLTGYWEEGACMLTIAPATGAATAVLVGGDTVITDANGKPVAIQKLKRGMAVEVTLGAASKIKSEPPTYVATKLVVKKAAPKGQTADGAELADGYDAALDR